ncbi:LptA/OstA family protein [Chitinivibrio alkaliphilus]|uniref:OstA-like protein n=1 Tax=Chitinivibrio alkaliphilus ACht1 TaxID=1313304 RepID=U7D9K4_9BACT|nr:LptA/OstA family protein [Chitinivibrio alkaliphilus]ERP31767.1 OstA-like protein [Chitinivibrio alkaliphilus ACht1]
MGLKLFLFLCIGVSISVGEGLLHLIHAQRNENVFEDNRLINRLMGDVRFRYDDMVIGADTVEVFRREGRFALRGNLRIDRPGYGVRAERGTYDSDLARIRLTGDVSAHDTVGMATLFGDTADYFMQHDSLFVFSRSGVVTWADTSLTDSMSVLQSHTLSYFDGRFDAAREVRITDGDLLSRSDSARFWPRRDSAFLFGNVHVEAGDAELMADTLTVQQTGQFTERFSAFGGDPALFIQGDAERYELYGDTLVFTVQDAVVQYLDVYGRGRFRQYDSSSPLPQVSLSGETLFIDLSRGYPEQLHAYGSVEILQYERHRDDHTTLRADTVYATMDSAGTVRSMDSWIPAMVSFGSDFGGTDSLRGDTVRYEWLSEETQYVYARGRARGITRIDSHTVNSVAGDEIDLRVGHGLDAVVIRGEVSGRVKQTGKRRGQDRE